ncbi:GntR family transcriptional regulator [Marivibrio halodurans]|uniref:GntR family transcriptional regulator n=1 Tax=Marivibrio halodurans TaxID=2039722 RepID=A0A8J7SI37_9PROT|nr:GntR family transcriptional regulator [Marivibrio halodurans]MBP5856838.1 GntR family transcriptional regulator [Marivibrio halodurans]
MSDHQTMRVTTVSAPIRHQVVEAFRSAIVSGRFVPGERLVERELCDLTGASRTSVREALRQLESEGLVEMVANRGAIVAMISAEQAREIYEVREALETYAGVLFVQKATAAQVATLRRSVDKIADAYASRELTRILEAKDAFYKILFKGAGNEMIASILTTMNARVSLLRRLSLDSGTRSEQSLRELKDILAGVEARDEAATHDACRKHVQGAAAAALSRLVR